MNITWALLMMALGSVGVQQNQHDAEVAIALKSAMNPPSSLRKIIIQMVQLQLQMLHQRQTTHKVCYTQILSRMRQK